MTASSPVRPTGDDAATAFPWTPFPSVPATKFDKVDEAISDDDSTTMSTSDDLNLRIDRFTKPVVGLPAGATIDSVVIYTYARRDDGGASGNPNIYEGVRIGASTYYGSAHALSGGAYTLNSTTWATDPSTGVAWLEAAVDAMKFDIKGQSVRKLISKIYYYDLVYCTQVWMVVNYTLSSGAKMSVILDVGPHPRTRSIFRKSLKKSFY